jgi:endonuclease G
LKDGVQVPEACYKIIVDEENGVPRVLAFIVPQDVTGSEPPKRFLTSVDEVEQETGLDFLCDLPDELGSRLEAETVKAMC